jgi:polysaccharide export outer membrane protein
MRLGLLFATVLVLSSCVSNKKITMLQKGDIKIKHLPKDSVVRTYAIDTFNYKIQPNDLLSVRFESLTEKEYNFFNSGTVQQSSVGALAQGGALLMGELVDERGEIPFPVIGKVKVSGLTIHQIQDHLQNLASQYITNPIVKVRLLNFRITILGEVAHEGTVTLANNRVSMIEAIATAGGLGELADRSNIKLIRQKGGRSEIQYIDLRDESFINSPYYYVYQNDILVVRPLKQRPFRRYFGQNLSVLLSGLSLVILTINLTTH